MENTLLWVAQIMVRGISIETIIADFQDNYRHDVTDGSNEQLVQALKFFEDYETDFQIKRKYFLDSTDMNPSEQLDELWCSETAEYYTDMYFLYGKKK